jgi:wobble nucleotide-excising tRNase
MMINNHIEEDHRRAFIAQLDPLLEKHDTEYQYLFKRLHTFQSDGTLESVYDIPNVARKVLDTFLMFRVPSRERMYSKLETLDFDEDKKTAIYKFVNDMSHVTGDGFDPSLVSETQKNVKYLLELIESTFPEHYKILVEDSALDEAAE